MHFGGTTAEIVGAHTVTADPMFTNPTTNLTTADFSLKKGSPAIAKGVDLTNLLLPYNWPKYSGAAPDIGALAYQNAAVMLRGTSAQAPPTFRARGYFVKSRVLIKTKQGNFNIRGERVKGGRSEVMGHG